MSDPIGAFFDRLAGGGYERLLRKTAGTVRFELVGDDGLDVWHLTIADGVLAENSIRAAQAACSYSCRMPPSRSLRWTRSWLISSGLASGVGNGRSGRALAMPWCGRCVL
ncbi:hypothetical protein SAMN04489832_7213 [Micromonospora cremea]|uniref:SCP-2 sterol transfer family protein n=1 Tax=Micromonospora cremea TaxID=709881 RepID=A0A1N6BD93_9ACTN|nr:hypothetical protein SAMN04489832_7213 [Micromonospora cremea]